MAIIPRLQVRYVEGMCAADCDGAQIAAPKDAAAFLMKMLGQEAVEVFGMLCLTTRHRVIGYHEISRGTIDSTLVHPREVFKAALLVNAAAVVLGHNHPSADPTPSEEDVALTARLVAAAELIGVPVLDHVIVGGSDGYFSFSEKGIHPKVGGARPVCSPPVIAESR